MNFISYASKAELMAALSDMLAKALAEAIATDGRASLAVPGGTTPGPLFDHLCRADLPWDKVRVMLTDERWVPESSERSNTALLRARLLRERAAAAELVPLYAEAASPEAGLPALAEGVQAALPLTVCVLGMGADMHTASLFPGADLLREGLIGPDLLYPMRAPGAPEPRITLSAEVLNGAAMRHIVILGAEKRAALERAQGLDPLQAPVAAILPGSQVHWAAE